MARKLVGAVLVCYCITLVAVVSGIIAAILCVTGGRNGTNNESLMSTTSGQSTTTTPADECSTVSENGSIQTREACQADCITSAEPKPVDAFGNLYDQNYEILCQSIRFADNCTKVNCPNVRCQIIEQFPTLLDEVSDICDNTVELMSTMVNKTELSSLFGGPNMGLSMKDIVRIIVDCFKFFITDTDLTDHTAICLQWAHISTNCIGMVPDLGKASLYALHSIFPLTTAALDVKCKAAFCPAPPMLKNGSVSRSIPSANGFNIVYECNKHHIMLDGKGNSLGTSYDVLCQNGSYRNDTTTFRCICGEVDKYIYDLGGIKMHIDVKNMMACIDICKADGECNNVAFYDSNKCVTHSSDLLGKHNGSNWLLDDASSDVARLDGFCGTVTK